MAPGMGHVTGGTGFGLPGERRLLLAYRPPSHDQRGSVGSLLCDLALLISRRGLDSHQAVSDQSLRYLAQSIPHHPPQTGEKHVFSSWAITDALERAIPIRRARLALMKTYNFFPVFVLPGCPARLADVYK